MTCKNNFYLSIISQLKQTTNLIKIQNNLNISKQNLNYYLRQLKKRGFIYNKGKGWWELTEKGKNPTKYGIFLKKDYVRGHALVWNVYLPRKIEKWKERVKILENKKVNYKLVGAKENTPRIKVLGRKVWLCNDHLRIFDIEKASYYGNNAIESRKNSTLQLFRIVIALENKLGFFFRPFNFSVRKEHFALIKNDLAIDMNQKGIILRISDEEGEWLLVDDSLGEGGELENIGKKAFNTNIPMQKWWNENKKDEFKISNPDNLKKRFGEIDENFSEVVDRIKKSSELMIDSELRFKQLEARLRGNDELIYQLIEVIKNKK